MPKKEHHVTYDQEKDMWKIQKNKTKRASAYFKSKDKAVSEARKMSINQKTELVIHTKDGKIAQKDSHGNDPKRIRG